MSEDDRVKPFDVPIENVPGSQLFGSPIIDFAGVRISHGLRKFHHRRCEHKTLVYSIEERRIWCEECERTIDGFEAFMTLTRSFQNMKLAAEAEARAARDALGAHLVRRAAKAVDRTWGHKMAVCCPHCDGGILAHDMLIHGSISAEIEIARRKRKQSGMTK